MGQEKRAAPRERNRRERRPSPSSDSAKLPYERSANSALPARYHGGCARLESIVVSGNINVVPSSVAKKEKKKSKEPSIGNAKCHRARENIQKFIQIFLTSTFRGKKNIHTRIHVPSKLIF